MIKIGIDARFVGPQGTGLGKYTEKLVENLAAIDHKNNYVIFLTTAGSKQNYKWGSKKNFKIKVTDIPWYSVGEQHKLPKILKGENLDLLHVPHFNVPIFYRGKFIVTIHDIIHHKFSETSATTKNPLLFKIKRLAYKKVINSTVTRSQKIIVPSGFVKEQMLSHFKISPSKVVVTYEAAEEEYVDSSKFKIQDSKLLEEYKIKQPFIIYVGNAYPHKNLDKLLEAFKLLTANREPLTNNLSLVIVCARDIFANRLKQKIDELNLSDRATLTGYIGANELPAIFRKAEAYVFPTLSEGFGIPGLNAMASGLPVICSDIPTLKEIYGNAAFYFDPEDPADIANKIISVLIDDKTRTDLVKKGSEQVKKYSWRKMAQETLKVYLSV